MSIQHTKLILLCWRPKKIPSPFRLNIWITLTFFLKSLPWYYWSILRSTSMLLNCKKVDSGPIKPIHNLKPVRLKILKTYIESNQANDFISASKSFADAFILFDQKLDESFWLCINYQSLNNLIIKNWYPILLMSQSLDQLDCTKRFTQLDLTSAYFWIRIQEGNKWKTAFRT